MCDIFDKDKLHVCYIIDKSYTGKLSSYCSCTSTRRRSPPRRVPRGLSRTLSSKTAYARSEHLKRFSRNNCFAKLILRVELLSSNRAYKVMISSLWLSVPRGLTLLYGEARENKIKRESHRLVVADASVESARGVPFLNGSTTY